MAKSKKSKTAAKVEVVDKPEQDVEETTKEEEVFEDTQEETTPSEEVEATESAEEATAEQEQEEEPAPEEEKKEEPEQEAPAESEDPTVAYVKETVDIYIKQMSPGVAVDDGIVRRNQIALLNIFNVTLRNAGTFDQNVKFLLKTFRDGRGGVFSDAYAFRGFNALRLSTAQYKRFESLFTLFLAAADAPSPKQVSKHIDLNIVSRYLNGDDERDLIFSFFAAG